MQRREKILAAAVGGLLLALGIRYVYSGYAAGVQQRQGRIKNLISRKQEQQRKAVDAADASEEIAQIESRSLPADQELARSLYQNWLLEQVALARLKDASVAATRGVPHGEDFTILPFTLRTHGDMEGLSKFLYALYSSPHLHQLQRVMVKPLDNGELDLTFTIEALSLPSADRADALSPLPKNTLRGGPEDFAAIGKRRLFSLPGPSETAARPPGPSNGNGPSPARNAVLTFITDDGDAARAWVNVRTTGQRLKLAAGDEIALSDFRARVVQISAREMVIELDGGRKRIGLGESLTSGSTVAGDRDSPGERGSQEPSGTGDSAVDAASPAAAQEAAPNSGAPPSEQSPASDATTTDSAGSDSAGSDSAGSDSETPQAGKTPAASGDGDGDGDDDGKS